MRKFLQIADGTGVEKVLADTEVSKSGSYKFVKDFISAGLITKEPARQVGHLLVLTEKGKKVAQAARVIQEQLGMIEQIDELYREDDAKRELESLTSYLPVEKLEGILKDLREKNPSPSRASRHGTESRANRRS